MKKEKIEFISSITHELKHKYDKFKKPKTSLTARGEYITFTNNNFENIVPINRFLHNLYFTHTIENLVRPSELAGAIDAGEITKKGFYKFLTNERVFKQLKEIQGFTYEGFREQLKNDIDKIKTSFDNNDVNRLLNKNYDIADFMRKHILISDFNMKIKVFHTLMAIQNLFNFYNKKVLFFSWSVNIKELAKEAGYENIISSMNILDGDVETFAKNRQLKTFSELDFHYGSESQKIIYDDFLHEKIVEFINNKL
jgi:hypothetical protein